MKTKLSITTLLRIAMGFTFLWAFLDKTFGLGFATTKVNAWIAGGSPTVGFLSHAVKGPFAGLFHSLSGVALVDWLFMIGLLFVGVSLLANRFVKWAAIVGSLMLFLMYLALLLPENNPIIDDHIIYILVLISLALHSNKK